VLDDLQWAGAASLRVLSFLVSNVRDRPLLTIGTYRPDELHPDDVEMLGRAGMTLALGGLDEQAVGQLLSLAAGRTVGAAVSSTVRQRAAGNPLFIWELGRLMAASGRFDVAPAAVPPAVNAVLQRRLARLSEATIGHLQVGAIIGKHFSSAMVAEMTGDSCDHALDAAAAAGVIERTSRPGDWSFTHDLIRDVVLESTPNARRVVVHLALARMLSEQARADRSLHAAIARHLEAAGPDHAAEAAAHWRQAADWATTMLADEEAAVALARARALTSPDDPVAIAGLQLAEADARLRTGDLDGARACCLEAAANARRAGRADLLASAALQIAAGVTGWEVPIADDSYVALLEEALAGVGPDSHELRSMLLARLSVAAARPETLTETRARAAEALALARKAGNSRVLAHALAAMCDAYAGPEHAEMRRAHAEAILAAATDAGEPGLALLGRRFLVVANLELGRFVELDREIARFAREAEALRQPLVSWYAPLFRGMRALLRGDIAEADRRLADVWAAAGATRSSNAEMLAATLAIGIAAATGCSPDVDLESITVVDPALWPSYASGLGYLALLKGDIERAAEMLALHAHTDFSIAVDSEQVVTLLGFSRIALATGDLATAARMYRFLLPYPGQWAVDGIAAWCWGPVDLELARLAAAIGERERAAAHLTDAQAEIAAAGARLHELDAARLAAELAEPAGPPIRDENPPLAAPPDAAFRWEGGVWALTWAGRTVRLRDAKGLADLARLLNVPGHEISAADLYGVPVEGPSGVILDDRARAAYRRRIAELDEELADADRRGDHTRSERAATEREALLAELSGALGLRGRSRSFASSSERARKAVSTRIRLAIDRIEAVHPPLARHLRNSVRTGTFCSYEPESPVTWTL
jgi:hypothetical protein